MTGLREEAGDLAADLAPTQQEKEAVSGFVRDVTRDLKQLVQQEVALARAEVGAEAGKAGKGAALLAGAGFAALMGVIFLSTALWWGLANVMDQSWAALIVAGLWLVLAAVMFVVGRGVLKTLSLRPDRTIDSLRQLPGAFRISERTPS